MPLFKTIQQIAQYVTISSASTTSPLPKQRLAEEEYIIPVLGADLFNDLQSQVTADAITMPDLLDKVRFALAFLIYYKELPLLHTIITDTGLRTVTNDKIQGAYRYQYEGTLQHLENEGLAALERLYVYLMENAGTFPTWASSEAFARLNKNLIKTGQEFSQFYYLFQPNRTFFSIQPVMQEVEDFYIKPALDSASFISFKDATTPSAGEVIVIDYLKKAVANLTIHKAIAKLSVKIRPEGFTVMLGSSDRSPASESNAGADQLERLFQDTFKDGNAYLNKAIGYLNANASATIFPNYFASPYYKSPDTSPQDLNDYNGGLYAF